MAKCVAFLLLAFHFLTFGAQILSVALFWQTGNHKCFGISLAALLVTGCFFADTVWKGARWRQCGVQVLPIKRLPCCTRTFCCCPLMTVCGCLQGVMVPLTLEQVDIGDSHGGGTGQGPTVTSFHGKAVNGLFEGIICSAVLLYAYLGTGFPASEPVTYEPPSYPLKFLGLRQVLRVVGLVSFSSGGLGILHLDHCLCMKLGAYIRSGRYPLLRLLRHWLFRTCELVFRLSLHVLYLLVTWEYVVLWRWMPLLLSLLFSVAMMYLFGGNEANRLVMWLCGFLCTFVDVFRFVDSPYKRRAARRLSAVLACRHVVELVYIPSLAVLILGWFSPDPHPGLATGASRLIQSLNLLTKGHPLVMPAIAATVPLFFCLRFSISVQRFLGQENDIFESCEHLNVEEVRRLVLGGVRVDANCQDNEGRTPLVRALLYGLASDKRCATVCGILIEGGARLDLKCPVERVWIRRLCHREARYQWTPLHLAAHRGSPEVLRELLRHVPVDMPADGLLEAFKDNAGSTPLHVAVSFGKAEAVKCLVARFPDWKDVQNRKGETPKDLARSETLKQALNSPALAAESFSGDGSLAWAVEEHLVARISGKPLYRAPGLCSFVVGSAGGPAVGSVLRLQPEDPLRQEELQRDTTQINNVREPRGNGTPAMLTAEELEPITKGSRVPCESWVLRVQSQQEPDVGQLISSIRQKGFCREAVLGKGAYGVVWLARRRGQEGGELFAVKNIAGTGAVARREFDMSNQVRILPHPNLVRLFGVQEFVDAEVSVLIMEFIPGGDLLEAIKDARTRAQGRAQPYGAPVETVPWLGQIFLALEHLHVGMHVLLRDLKPENVVLDSRRRAKLIDLGLGRIGTKSDGGFTLTASPPGTPGYCAPEVLLQQSYNEKADIYSFGVTAWMLLTGGLRSHARPPSGFNGRIESCFDDCELLQQCINDPDSNDAEPIDLADAYAFVTTLTALLADRRPDHVDIRAHAFFANHLEKPLPERRAGRRAVEHWLEELGF